LLNLVQLYRHEVQPVRTYAVSS